MAKAQQWFRLYSDVVNDPKVQRLSADLFRFWVNMLCLAARHEGCLPPLDEFAFQVRLKEQDCQKKLNELVRVGLVDHSEDGTLCPHNWEDRQFKSDVSTSRVRKFREQRRNVSVAVNGTPPEQSRAEQIQSRNRTEQKDPADRRRRNSEMLTNVAGLMEQYFEGNRPKPDLLIATRVHDALGDPCTWERIVAFRDFLAIKRDSAFLPESYGIFLSWAEMVCRQCDELDGGEDAASGV